MERSSVSRLRDKELAVLFALWIPSLSPLFLSSKLAICAVARQYLCCSCHLITNDYRPQYSSSLPTTDVMEDIEYKLEAVKATRVPSEEIDQTFRSSCIGPSTFLVQNTNPLLSPA